MRTLFILLLTLLAISALIIACLAFTQKPKNSEYYKINCCIPNNSQIVTNEYYHKNLSKYKLGNGVPSSTTDQWTRKTKSTPSGPRSWMAARRAQARALGDFVLHAAMQGPNDYEPVVGPAPSSILVCPGGGITPSSHNLRQNVVINIAGDSVVGGWPYPIKGVVCAPLCGRCDCPAAPPSSNAVAACMVRGGVAYGANRCALLCHRGAGPASATKCPTGASCKFLHGDVGICTYDGLDIFVG